MSQCNEQLQFDHFQLRDHYPLALLQSVIRLLLYNFRPLVDLYVAKYVVPNADELQPTDKVALVGLLNVDVGMPRGAMSALSAIDNAVESLARIYESGPQSALELPALIGLNQHWRES